MNDRRAMWRGFALTTVLAIVAFFGARALFAVSARYQATHGPGGGKKLETATAIFGYRSSDGALFATALDGSGRFESKLIVSFDGVRAPAIMKNPDSKTPGLVQGDISIAVADVRVDATLTLHAFPEQDSLLASLIVHDAKPAETSDERVSLVLETSSDDTFVPGLGIVADTVSAQSSFVVVGASAEKARPVGIASAPEGTEPPLLNVGARIGSEGLVVSLWPENGPLRVTYGDSGGTLFSTLYASEPELGRVFGIVHGTKGAARVIGLDEDGAPRVRFSTSRDGRFDVRVPASIVNWYASVLDTKTPATSSPTFFKPETGYELVLDVSEGGELEVHITDADTQKPITARLLVHGVEGTLDPSFGPDYRSSGAGPIMDSLRGSVVTPLPKGRYRVLATKGIEWSIDGQVVTIESGKRVVLNLAPRHVVPTPGWVGCDLHVHARPSFDSPVSTDDRVLSLVSAGVDFAVPTEHNIVGDYGPSLDVLGLTGQLATVHGVEVTTYSPRFGHFGVFPYPMGSVVPPYRATTPDHVFAAAHASDPTRILQVNHPRLPNSIGYFDTSGYVPGGRIPRSMRTDFDALEVYNGYDLAVPSRVDAVMTDWFNLLNDGFHFVATGSSDSHRIQYQWAGYPRTLVHVNENDAGENAPIDPLEVVAELKKGHASVTSGPILEIDFEGGHEGDRIERQSGGIHGRILVRAAPWVDVTSLEIVVNGHVVQTFPIESRTTTIGPELGTLAEAQARTIRLDQEIHLEISSPSWLVAVARGTRLLDDVLPFMPIKPLGFTNPIWIR